MISPTLSQRCRHLLQQSLASTTQAPSDNRIGPWPSKQAFDVLEPKGESNEPAQCADGIRWVASRDPETASAAYTIVEPPEITAGPATSWAFDRVGHRDRCRSGSKAQLEFLAPELKHNPPLALQPLPLREPRELAEREHYLGRATAVELGVEVHGSAPRRRSHDQSAGVVPNDQLQTVVTWPAELVQQPQDRAPVSKLPAPHLIQPFKQRDNNRSNTCSFLGQAERNEAVLKVLDPIGHRDVGACVLGESQGELPHLTRQPGLGGESGAGKEVVRRFHRQGRLRHIGERMAGYPWSQGWVWPAGKSASGAGSYRFRRRRLAHIPIVQSAVEGEKWFKPKALVSADQAGYATAMLFAPERWDAFVAEVARDRAALCRKLALVQDLLRRHRDGTVTSLPESRVEQSFNERLFAEVFDYRTLFRHGAGDYHLEPKQHHGQRRYDDFALGFFSPTDRDLRVTAELKGAGTDLDALQAGGSHKGTTPVQQAFAAISGQPCRWVLVSNFDEIRLYHLGDSDNYEVVHLTDIVSPRDMARAWALLGRPPLLGLRGQRSPLDRLYEGGSPMPLPPKPGAVRLMHQATASTVEVTAESTTETLPSEQPLSKTYRHLRAALERFGPLGWPNLKDEAPALEADRLIMLGEDMRLELTTAGVLRVWERLRGELAADDRPSVSVKDLVFGVGEFIRIAAQVLAPLFGQHARFDWSLLDAAGARLEGLPQRRSPSDPRARCYSTDEPVIRSWLTTPVDVHLGLDSKRVIPLAMEAANEMLFHFHWTEPESGKLVRMEAGEDDVRQILGA